MRWTPGRRSSNLEDRRGASGGGGRGGAGLGIGGLLILLVLSLVFKKDFLSLANDPSVSGGGSAPTGAPIRSTPAEDSLVDFVSFVLDDTQNTWTSLFAADGQRYGPATLVLYRNATPTACGTGQSASGPFYCPADQKVYVDLDFFDELHERFGAPGDFAQAYVLAHEIGHHIQTLTGTSDQVRQLQQRNPSQANALSVRLELQADCYAGVWAHAAAQRNLLETGDAQEGLGAAAAVGDDRLQRMAGARVTPEGFTHGSAAQRMEWFQKGLRDGSPGACDTFANSR